MHTLPLIGWREWCALPELGIAVIKAKIDTGARSSCLHVDSLHEFVRDGVTWLRFELRPRHRRGSVCVVAEARATDRRIVRDSGGHTSERWFIDTTLVLGGIALSTEINLTSRGGMLFPLLVGRTALDRRFHIDPSRSFVCGRPVSNGVQADKNEHSNIVT